jgi:hypothetical protein
MVVFETDLIHAELVIFKEVVVVRSVNYEVVADFKNQFTTKFSFAIDLVSIFAHTSFEYLLGIFEDEINRLRRNLQAASINEMREC